MGILLKVSIGQAEIAGSNLTKFGFNIGLQVILTKCYLRRLMLRLR